MLTSSSSTSDDNKDVKTRDRSQWENAISLARVYREVNLNRPPDEISYGKSFHPHWNPHGNDEYEIIRKIGRGKYSEVFHGVGVADDSHEVVIKVLKPVKKTKIRREIKILQMLKSGPNIIALEDIVREKVYGYISLIFEYVDAVDFKVVYPTFTEMEIKYYLFQLLRAVDFCHSHGVMHRDIKPHNVVIDHKQRKLRLIDWGLAELYLPGTEYNVRVASRYFKGPELLVNMRYYDYSLDMWSVGCMMAGMIYMVHPFFEGKDNVDQLLKILKVLGSSSLKKYVEKYNIVIPSEFNGINLWNYHGHSFQSLVTPRCNRLCTPDALDLVSKLIVMDHQGRLTAREAMEHRYFDAVRPKDFVFTANSTTNYNMHMMASQPNDSVRSSSAISSSSPSPHAAAPSSPLAESKSSAKRKSNGELKKEKEREREREKEKGKEEKKEKGKERNNKQKDPPKEKDKERPKYRTRLKEKLSGDSKDKGSSAHGQSSSPRAVPTAPSRHTNIASASSSLPSSSPSSSAPVDKRRKKSSSNSVSGRTHQNSTLMQDEEA